MGKMRMKTIGSKMTVLFVLFALVLITTLCLFSYYASWDEYTDFFSAKAQQTAALAARYVDGDKISGYLKTGKTDAYYDELQKTLSAIKEEQKVLYLYVFKPEDDQFSYIMDVQIDTDNKKNISHLGDVYEYLPVEYEHLVADVQAKRASTVKVIAYNPVYGAGVSAWAPVLDSNGDLAAMVEVDLSLQLVIDMLRGYMINIVLMSCAIVLVLVVALALLARRMVSRPLAKLTKNALSFASGETLASYETNLKTGDEMQTLDEAFGKMATDIGNYTMRLTAVAKEKERTATELNLATGIQTSMLPTAILGRDEFNVYAKMESSREIGGDFYDFFLIDPTHLCVVTADVSGKGIPAALFMVIAKTTIKNQMMTGMPVDKAMSVLSTRLYQSSNAGLTVSAFVGVLNTSTGLFTYVNAGQGKPMLMKKGGSYDVLESQDMAPLAEMENVVYRSIELTLRQGDRLLLYTDGVLQARNASGQEFGQDRLRTNLNIGRRENPELSALVQGVCQEITIFEDKQEHSDDVTVLALEYAKGDRGRAEISVRSRADSFARVQDFLRRQLKENGISGMFYANMSVALEEMFMLVVCKVSARNEIILRCTVDDITRLVEVALIYGDQEAPIMETLTEAQSDAVAFMRRSMDEIGYEYLDGRNVVYLRKYAV